MPDKEDGNVIIASVYEEQDAISRISQLNSRLLIYSCDYSTYINNKTFNT